MSKTEVTFSGFGGQGVVISSSICANALSLEGFKVLQTQSYGIEARGGASKGELIYSDQEVNYLEVDHPDVLIMLSDEAFNKYGVTAKSNGKAIVDSFYVDQQKIDDFTIANSEMTIYSAPFSQISIEKFERALFTNVIVLGYLCGVHKDLSLKSMEASVKKYIKEKFIKKNMEALQIGYNLAMAEVEKRMSVK